MLRTSLSSIFSLNDALQKVLSRQKHLSLSLSLRLLEFRKEGIFNGTGKVNLTGAATYSVS